MHQDEIEYAEPETEMRDVLGLWWSAKAPSHRFRKAKAEAAVQLWWKDSLSSEIPLYCYPPKPSLFSLAPLDYSTMVVIGDSEQSLPSGGYIETAIDLADIALRINQLAFQPAEDDYGLIRPSFKALTECNQLIFEAAKRSSPLRLPADIYTDRNSDIRISWKSHQREAELVCPSSNDEAPYIYYTDPKDFGTIENASCEALSKWITWTFGDNADAW